MHIRGRQRDSVSKFEKWKLDCAGDGSMGRMMVFI